MEQLALSVPAMWADHHVIAVRALFQQTDAVVVSGASARDTTLRLEYDPARTDPRRIADLLAQAGYPTDEAPEEDVSPRDKPAWATAGVRVTATDPADLSMSGDHRQY